MYLTFNEYIEFGGTISDEATFNEFEFEAAVQIDWYTFGRLHYLYEDTNTEPISINIKRCMYYIINLLQKTQSTLATPTAAGTTTTGEVAGIVQQSNDGVSITYNVLTAHELAESAKEKIHDYITHYLQNVRDSLGRKVLYRGIYPGE